MVTEIILENYRNGENRVSKGVRRDREQSSLPWKKILNLFNKSKAIWRYVRSHVMRSVPHLRCSTAEIKQEIHWIVNTTGWFNPPSRNHTTQTFA